MISRNGVGSRWTRPLLAALGVVSVCLSSGCQTYPSWPTQPWGHSYPPPITRYNQQLARGVIRAPHYNLRAYPDAPTSEWESESPGALWLIHGDNPEQIVPLRGGEKLSIVLARHGFLHPDLLPAEVAVVRKGRTRSRLCFIIVANTQDLVLRGSHSEDLVLWNGDTIFIPERS
ncbi:MAG: hypothetical protein V3T77_10015, partial [Planctomycetota bacterium]